MLHLPRPSTMTDIDVRRIEHALTQHLGEPVVLGTPERHERAHMGACDCSGCRGPLLKTRRAKRAPIRQPYEPLRRAA